VKDAGEENEQIVPGSRESQSERKGTKSSAKVKTVKSVQRKNRQKPREKRRLKQRRTMKR
jgi:hypothetical protein